MNPGTEEEWLHGAGMAAIAQRRTVLSPCRQYRYMLWREWETDMLFPHAHEYVMFIGLNPSTADETKDDPTIRKCIGFARRWGFGALCMTNLFALRATKPKTMLAHGSPVGEHNDAWLQACAQKAGIVVAAWGTHGTHQGRDRAVMIWLEGTQCLRFTAEGHPEHPLYVPYEIQPQPFPCAA